MRSEMILWGGLLVLAGCGGGGDNATEAANGGVPAEVVDVAAAPAVAAPKGDCDTVKGQTAPEGQPADDIMGIRQGMTAEQVRNVLQCKNASFAINSRNSTVSLPGGGSMPRVDVYADTGLEKVNVWLVGPAGQERVVHVDRRTEYTAGKELPVDSIEKELAAKYGGFDTQAGGRWGRIVRSRDGQRITQDNSSYGQCASHNITTDRVMPCLNVVSYEIGANNQNPALASNFNVAITSQAAVAEMTQAAQAQQGAAVEAARDAVNKQGLGL